MSDLLKRISIEKPCSANWNEMKGNDQVRFCQHCDLSVQDLSQMTRARAMKLVRNSKGRLCLRIHRDPWGEVITRPVGQKLYSISRRASRFAAGAFTAMVSVSAAYSQTPSSDQPEPPQTTVEGIVDKSIVGRRIAPLPAVSHLARLGRVAVSRQHELPLTEAVSNEDMREVEQLLRSGVNVNAAEEDGTTALSITVGNGNFRITRRLLQAGANPDAITDNGGNILFSIDDDTDMRLVNLLLKHGANPNKVNNDGDTPLTTAAEWDDGELIQALIDAGATLNAQNHDGDSALMIAAMEGNVETVEVLIAAGANINLRNSDGDDALSLVGDDESEIGEMLLKAGAVKRDPEDIQGEDEDED